MRLNKPNQKKYEYLCTTICKLSSVDFFFPRFAVLLSLSQTESALPCYYLCLRLRVLYQV